MSMVRLLRFLVPALVRHAGRVAGRLAVAVWACFAASPLAAQAPGVHYQHSSVAPPGAIGSWQLQRGGPLPGYFQPVEIKAPPGALISLAAEGRFQEPAPTPVVAGMLIGSVYRLRVTHLPLQEGAEVFPTIELIDRLYAPVGQEWRFPIQIELTRQDLDLALAGKFVTRVVYLEDPESAVPAAQVGTQLWFEARAGENPLEVADTLGRPMAIVRIGGRLPVNPESPDPGFLYGSPPVVRPLYQRPVLPQPAPRMPQAEPVLPQEAAAQAPAAYIEAFTPPATYWDRKRR